LLIIIILILRSLLISLAILKALATECRRDISLLSPSLVAAVDVTLASLPSDLEVSARAASVVSVESVYMAVANFAFQSSLHGLPTQMVTLSAPTVM
jgi:hypothetical protein